MSREFGDDHYHDKGFFHERLGQCADTCLTEGRDELTKLWGAVLQELTEVAWSISSSEACDSGPDDTILRTIRDLPRIQAAFKRVEEFVKPFERVAENAVRLAAKSGGKP